MNEPNVAMPNVYWMHANLTRSLLEISCVRWHIAGLGSPTNKMLCVAHFQSAFPDWLGYKDPTSLLHDPIPWCILWEHETNPIFSTGSDFAPALLQETCSNIWTYYWLLQLGLGQGSRCSCHLWVEAKDAARHLTVCRTTKDYLTHHADNAEVKKL